MKEANPDADSEDVLGHVVYEELCLAVSCLSPCDGHAEHDARPVVRNGKSQGR